MPTIITPLFTPTEEKIIDALTDADGACISTSDLEEIAIGSHFVSHRLISVHVSNLRAKGFPVRSVYGVGYRWAEGSIPGPVRGRRNECACGCGEMAVRKYAGMSHIHRGKPKGEGQRRNMSAAQLRRRERERATR